MTAGMAGILLVLALLAGVILFRQGRSKSRRGLLVLSFLCFAAALVAVLYVAAVLILLGGIN